MNFYFKPLSVSLARGFDATCFPYLIHVSRILKVPTRKAEFFFRETVFESWSSPRIAGRWPRGSSGTSRSPVSRSGQPLRRSSGPGPWRKPSTPSSTNLSPEKFTNTIRFGASVASQRFSGVGFDSIKKMEACKNAAASLFYKGGQLYKRAP